MYALRMSLIGLLAIGFVDLSAGSAAAREVNDAGGFFSPAVFHRKTWLQPLKPSGLLGSTPAARWNLRRGKRSPGA